MDAIILNRIVNTIASLAPDLRRDLIHCLTQWTESEDFTDEALGLTTEESQRYRQRLTALLAALEALPDYSRRTAPRDTTSR